MNRPLRSIFGLGAPFAVCALAASLHAAPLVQATRAAQLTPTDCATSIANLAASVGVERIKLGTSRSGQVIEALRFTAGGESPAINKPAILIVANIDGARPYASALALQLAERLQKNEAGATQLLEASTVFIVAQPNPDASRAHSTTPLVESSATGHGRDNDRDGQMGEDPLADVNGDGLITWMRVPDPSGTMIASPHDPRVTVEADTKHAERGMWKLIREGFDSDGDDEVAEDGLLDAEVQHNFPAGFKDHTAKAGLYGGHEPEAKALMDFVIAHPELALVITLDGQDTLVSAPETSKSSGGGRFGPRVMPDGKVIEQDAAIMAEIGRQFIEHAKDAPKADSMQAGSFQRWVYEHRGVLTLDSALWVMPTKAPKDETPDEEVEEVIEEEALDDGDADMLAALGYAAEEVDEEAVGQVEGNADEEAKDQEPEHWRKKSDDVGRLEWVDATGEAWRFVDWQAFEHPQLGPVEIGGWAPFALIDAPAAVREGLADDHWQLLTSLGHLMPKVEVTNFTAENLGSNLWRIEARVENPGLLPLINRAASRARTWTNARLELGLPKDATIINGQTPQFIGRLDGLGQTGNSGEFEWLIHTDSPGDLSLTITTRNAGDCQASIEIKTEAR